MSGNIINAVFCGTSYITTRPAWLIDYGMVLKLTGIELPEVYEVDFANTKTETATRVLGGPDGVTIPDMYFLTPNAQQIFAWLYLHTGEDDGYTRIQVTIPINKRPDVTDVPPTPEEQSIIEQAIVALNDGVDRAETAADNAEQSAQSAADAVEHVQQTVNDALQEAKDSGEFDGTDGVNGVIFTPDVDAAGNISWTNDGGLPNPQTRNIKGPKGDKLTYADLTAADKADLVQGPIADAQTAAVNAVNSKGEEVIQSIPSDYTELSDDVDDLKSAVKDDIKYLSDGYNLFNCNFVRGWLDDGVLKTTITYGIASDDLISFDEDVVINIIPGFRVNIQYFVDGDFSISVWRTQAYSESERTILKDTTFKIAIRRATDDTTEIADIETFRTAVYITNNLFNKLRYVDIKSVALLMPNYYGGEYAVKVDSISKTVTFPYGTVIYDSKNGTIYSTESVTLSYAGINSARFVIYYRPSTNALALTWYGAALSNEDILIGAFNTSSKKMAITCPYVWDGLYMGVNTNTYSKKLHAFAHRGYSLIAPENTLIAFKMAKQYGFNAVETDVAFTRDDVPVLLHDATIDRTSNGSGNIGDLDYNTVRTYDFGSWKNAEFAGEKIPSVEEFIILCRNIGLCPLMELKANASYTRQQIESVVDIVKNYNMLDDTIFTSFNAAFLEYVKDYDATASLFLASNGLTDSEVQTANNLKTGTNKVGISLSYQSDIASAITKCRTNNLPLYLWTIDNRATMLAVDPYVSGVISDSLAFDREVYADTMSQFVTI